MVKRGLILGGTLVLFSGVFVSNVFADGDLDLSITVEQASLQLTVPATANLDLTPTSAAADFKSTNLTIKVGTNNVTGYTLTMSVPSTDISRIGAASGDPVIGTLASQEGGYSENDFTANKWGYKITGNNYFPVTTTLSPNEWVTDGPANNVDNTITLASKVNTAIPSGTYKTTLTFQAVANQVPPVSLELAYRAYGKQKVTVGNDEYYKMQDMTTDICNLVTEIPSQLEVVDVRDNTIYHIAKLADERCWMQDNLALDPTNSDTKANLSSDNTNAIQAAIINFKNGGNPDNNEGWSTSAIAIASYNSSNEPYVAVSDIETVATGSSDVLRSQVQSGNWKVGVYYNYCAVSMGTYCYDSGDIDKDQSSAIDTKNDICPVGWRLPTGGPLPSDGGQANGGEYQVLYDHYSGATGTSIGSKYYNFRLSFRLPLSGSFTNRTTYNHGNLADFWTSTYNKGGYMSSLSLSSSSVSPQGYNHRSVGLTVRCVAK